MNQARSHPSPLIGQRLRHLEQQAERIEESLGRIDRILQGEDGLVTRVAIAEKTLEESGWVVKTLRGNGKSGLSARIDVAENDLADIREEIKRVEARFEEWMSGFEARFSRWNTRLDEKIEVQRRTSGGTSSHPPTLQELVVQTFQDRPGWSVVTIALLLLCSNASEVWGLVSRWLGGG